ncbi:unnamed protein product [Prorocentrum cordatum]|uniref:Uncharacterized protein n=1 Tax=Prorocentrum cordatum TaxID=2364126 RepID=A0ABN9VV33_9DINO|nr:unnamed protein product [Polarella glacialis]
MENEQLRDRADSLDGAHSPQEPESGVAEAQGLQACHWRACTRSKKTCRMRTSASSAGIDDDAACSACPASHSPPCCSPVLRRSAVAVGRLAAAQLAATLLSAVLPAVLLADAALLSAVCCRAARCCTARPAAPRSPGPPGRNRSATALCPRRLFAQRRPSASRRTPCRRCRLCGIERLPPRTG